MKILHLKNNAIDRELWNRCIDQSHNKLVYAYSWYLDVVSPNWEALVDEDYSCVMPLPVKCKYKIPYIVQPILTQQLGIFSIKKIDSIIVDNFIQQIPYFSYELNLNERNFYAKSIAFPNFVLNLKRTFIEIESHYLKNTIRNIEKAKKLGLSVRFDLTIKEFVDFYSSIEKCYLSVKFSTLENLLKAGIENKAITLCGVYSSENQLISALCLLHAPNRLIYLVPVSNAEGKASSAMFMLINSIIEKEAGNDKIFDFEGSKIEGIARFYKGFGAKNHPYFILKRLRPTFLIGK